MVKKLFKNKINSFFFTLFFKITLFVTLVIFLLSVLLYYKSEAVIKTILASSSQQRLEQIRIGAENMNNYIRRFVVAMYCADSKYSVTELLNNTLKDDYEKEKIFRSINSSLTTNPYVYSLHMLNIGNNIYYTAGPYPVAYSKYFYDTGILDLIKENYLDLKFRPIARIMPENTLPNAENLHVLSYIYFEKNIFNNSIGNIIVTNVRTEKLLDVVNSYNSSPINYAENILVIDENGYVIAHPEQSLFNHNIGDQEYIRTILSSKDKNSSFTSGDKTDKTFVTYSFSESLGWYFISLSPLDMVTKSVIQFRIFTIILCLTTLACGLLLSYFISRKLYSPVQNLQKTMSRLSGNSIAPCQESNEFDTMSLLYKETIEKLRDFRYFKLNNLRTLKQNLLRDLLHGKLPPHNETENLFKEYGIGISIDEKLVIIVFKIDDFDRYSITYNQNDRDVMLHAIENISSELLSEQFKCDTVSAAEDHTVAFIQLKDDVQEYPDQLFSIIKNIQSNLINHLGFSVTASIGPISANISDLCEIYTQTLENCDYRIIKGYNSIISPALNDHANRSPYSMPANKIKNLLDALKLQRYHDAVSAYHKIIDHMCEYPPRVIRLAIPFLFSRICECLSMIDNDISEVLSIDFVGLNKKLSSFETIEWANQVFYNLFQAICNKGKDHSSGNIVKKAMDIIRDNYTDPQLCSESIAGKLNLSTVYLRRVFRETNGMSISECINQIRMEKAKELLETSNLSISTILEKIGWYNHKYFFNIFKKTYGTTPNEYRLRRWPEQSCD